MRSNNSQKSLLHLAMLATSVLILLASAAGSLMAGSARLVPDAAAATAPAEQITPNHGPYHTVPVVTGQGFVPQ